MDYNAEGSIQVPPGEGEAIFPDGAYDKEIDSPERLLGFPVGERPARHAQLEGCLRRWAEQSPRITVDTYASTHEGRPLPYAIISAEKNIAQLDTILDKVERLADPRGLGEAEARRIVDELPAVAWLGHSIHGDELSGADAALALSYHLIADRSNAVSALLEEVVVVVDPAMNPDGRERYLADLAENAGYVRSLDANSMHRGRWPWGRGNHYLFDLNRDWISGVMPETRGRWALMQRFHPQLVIDAHEMGWRDTYLFSPANEPINPHQPASIQEWRRLFAKSHAATFDAHGWSYYTRDWHEAWYPGYSSEWVAFAGAVGILYEQASSRGLEVRRPSGRVMSYAETVRAQAVSSLTDLVTLSKNRAPLLRDYLEIRRRPMAGDFRRAFALRPDRAPDRERRFIETLLRQGIEVYVSQESFSAHGAVGVLGPHPDAVKLPIGTYVIPEAQPNGLLLRAVLDLDPRYSEAVLERERRELERKGRSRIYDVTAWDLAHAFAIDGYWIDRPKVQLKAVTELPPAAAGELLPLEEGTPTAWVVDGRDDASVAFAAQAMEQGLKLHIAEEAFAASGRRFVRGSLVVRRQENDGNVEEGLAKAAAASGVTVRATATSLSPDDGPDLGGHRFKLLHRPRIAVLANAPLSPTSYGHVWHQLDAELQVPFTLIDVHALKWYDLRRYNVLVVPPAWEPLGPLLKPYAEKIAAWVRSGGTLVAMGSAAADLCDTDLKLTTTRRRRDVLLEIDAYSRAAQRDIAARDIDVEPALVWGDRTPPAGSEALPPSEQPSPGKASGGGAGGPDAIKRAAEREDAWLRRFSPQGTFLRGLVDSDHWLSFGTPDQLPVLVSGDHALMAFAPAAVPVRLAEPERLRLAGLLWPEARTRLATTAYATTEQIDAGQIVLFVSSPVFRAQTRGSARLFSNAVVYGPSLGARQPIEW